MEGRQPQMVKMEGQQNRTTADREKERNSRVGVRSQDKGEGGPPQNIIIIIILRPSKRGFENEEYKIINLIMGMDKSIESVKQ